MEARKKLPVDPSKIKPFSFVEKEKQLQLRKQEKLEAKRKAMFSVKKFWLIFFMESILDLLIGPPKIKKFIALGSSFFQFPKFKAQAMPVGLPFVPIKSHLAVTEIQPFTLLTDERGTKYQQQFQEQVFLVYIVTLLCKPYKACLDFNALQFT